MKRTYQLIRLKVKTVQDLKRLTSLTAKGSLDDVIVSMIQITHDHYESLKKTGWVTTVPGGDVVEI